MVKKLVPDPFLKKTKLSISLDQPSKITVCFSHMPNSKSIEIF